MSKRPNIRVSNQTDGAVADYAEQRDIDKSEAYEELLQHALDFRPPMQDECEHLQAFMEDEYGFSAEEATHYLRTGYIAVKESYASNTPGYAGPLIFAIFGYPETYTLYAYEDEDAGELYEVQRESQRL